MDQRAGIQLSVPAADSGIAKLLPMLHSLNTQEAKEQSMRVLNQISEQIKESSTLNPRTQRRMQNLVENNILYFSNLSRTIRNHLVKSNFDKLLLEFRRCEIKLKNQSQDFYRNSLGCIQESLKLELKKRKLFSQIYLNLLRENKGKLQIAKKTKFQADNQISPDGKDSRHKGEEEEEQENTIGVKRAAPDSSKYTALGSNYEEDKKLQTKTEYSHETAREGFGPNDFEASDPMAADDTIGLFIFKRKKELALKSEPGSKQPGQQSFEEDFLDSEA